MVERTPESKKKVVLAKVDGEKITRGDLDEEMKALLESLKEKYGENFEENSELIDGLKAQREDELELIILRKVLMKYGEENNLMPTDEEVKTQVDEQIKTLKELAGTEESYVSELKSYYGMTPEEFEEYAKEMVIVNSINTKIREEISADIEVTDEEISKYYEENKSTYTTKAGADAYNVLLDSEAKAKEVRALIKNLDDFKKQADTYNTDSTKGKGGSLGRLTYESSGLVESVAEGFKNLNNGEVSQPIKSDYGWHLITVENVQKEDVVKPLDEVKDEIKKTITSTKAAEPYNKKIEEIKEKYNVKVYNDRF